MSRFNADEGSPPPNGLLSLLNQAVVAISDLSSDEVPKLAKLVTKWSDVLFEVYPSWYVPLFASLNGMKALCDFPEDHFNKIIKHKNSRRPLMQWCLGIQSQLQQPTEISFNMFSDISPLLDKLTPQLFVTISHYLHPDQSCDLTELQANLPVPATPFQPLHTQFKVPPEALPLLFPNFDTSQFNPDYGWFLHLLSKYDYSKLAPTPEGNQDPPNFVQSCELYTNKISSPTLFGNEFSIADTFIHNRHFNAYDEYLTYALPPILSQLDIPPHQPLSTPSLFSYFPTDHPGLSALQSSDFYRQLSSIPIFRSYFVYLFILGPSFSQFSAAFYQSITYAKFMPRFDCSPHHQICPSLSVQLAFFKYRTYLLTTDSGHLINHLAASAPTATSASTSSASTASTFHPHSPQPLQTTPPTFTTRYFPLLCSIYDRTIISTPTSEVLSAYHSLTLELEDQSKLRLLHLLYSIKFDPQFVDAHLLEYFKTNAITDPTPFNDTLEMLHFGQLLVARSYDLYLQGQPTLHQQLFDYILEQLLVSAKVPSTCLLVNSFISVMLYLFTLYDFQSPIILKHLLLCIHAGMLHPSTDSSNPVFVHLRSFLAAYLTKMTGCQSYFSPTTFDQLNGVLQIAPQLRFSLTQQHWSRAPVQQNVQTQIPQLTNMYSTSPSLTSFPEIRSALINDLGELLAIQLHNTPTDELTPSIPPLQQSPGVHNAIKIDIHLDELRTDPNAAFPECPYRRQNLSAQHSEWINSDESIAALNSNTAIAFQKALTKLHKSAFDAEHDFVQSVMSSTLYKAGLSSSPNHYSFPPLPSKLPSSSSQSTMARGVEEQDLQIREWALEILIVGAFQLHPSNNAAQPSQQTTPKQPINSNQNFNSNISAHSNPFFNSPSTRRALFLKTTERIFNTNSLLLPTSLKLLYRGSGKPTKSKYLDDVMLQCILDPMLKLYHTLAAIPAPDDQ